MNEEEIKQAFKVLKNGLDNPKEKSEHCFYFDEYQMNTIKNMVYNLEKELIQEKEKNKKLEDVINLMAQDFSQARSLEVMETTCKSHEECYQEGEGIKSCEECAKDYYFKKAKENEK